MDAARAHIIWTSTALVLISIASCLTYVFIAKVPECQRISIVNASSIENVFRQASREHWLLKAYNETGNRLLWDDEWEHLKSEGESILDDNNTWIVIREKGIYLAYIQVNFSLRPQNSSSSSEDLKLQVEFDDGNKPPEMFSATHDSQMVTDGTRKDAKLSTFLLMHLQPTNKLAVKAFPSDAVNYDSRPFSTFITIIKLADNW